MDEFIFEFNEPIDAPWYNMVQGNSFTEIATVVVSSYSSTNVYVAIVYLSDFDHLELYYDTPRTVSMAVIRNVGYVFR